MVCYVVCFVGFEMFVGGIVFELDVEVYVCFGCWFDDFELFFVVQVDGCFFW